MLHISYSSIIIPSLRTGGNYISELFYFQYNGWAGDLGSSVMIFAIKRDGVTIGVTPEIGMNWE
jgi:hypothetical protein